MKTFDFNAITQQTLETKLGDTTLHITTPPEKLIEQLASTIEDLTSFDKEKTAEQSRAAYALIAELMSCNTEGLKITGDDLRDKYKVAPLVLTAFAAAYMDFINEFHNAKN
jgi:hypothetical protein